MTTMFGAIGSGPARASSFPLRAADRAAAALPAYVVAMKIGYLDGPRLRRTLLAACGHAQGSRRELNRINVFPVPDGDTGTNLALTLRSVEGRVRRVRSRSVGDVAEEAAQGAVLGARGNCGMMLSHFLYGFAACMKGEMRVNARTLAHALKRGAANLYAAVDRPVEGTMLTVARDAAEVAVTSRSEDLAELMKEVLAEARSSLSRTPELLPVLKEAGVVDAGAKGLVSLIEGAVGFIGGELGRKERPEDPDAAETVRHGAAATEYPSESEKYRYCTEGLVRGRDLPRQNEVRKALREMGDSVLVIRAGDMLRVHVHADEPEAVFDYLAGLGELATRKAEDMHVQHATLKAAASHSLALARRPIVVVTDSGADLPPEVISQHGIHVTPLLLVDSDRTYRDGIDLTSEEFHLRLAEKSGSLPTTSQPTPGDFKATFDAALEEGETIVAVLLGSSLSGTMQSAEAASALFDAPVLVADSLGASLLEGLMALRACECAEAGWQPRAVVAEVERVRRKSGLLLCVHNLDRLARSGRVSARQATLARMLGIKPILEIDASGKVVPAGKAWGARRARGELLALLERRLSASGSVGAGRVRFGIMHVGAPEVVAPLTRELRCRYGAGTEVLASPATPTLSSHAGLGAWGVAWSADDGPPAPPSDRP